MVTVRELPKDFPLTEALLHAGESINISNGG
jgi:hypothetical protein